MPYPWKSWVCRTVNEGTAGLIGRRPGNVISMWRTIIGQDKPPNTCEKHAETAIRTLWYHRYRYVQLGRRVGVPKTFDSGFLGAVRIL